jgi:mannosyltransferase PIG-M
VVVLVVSALAPPSRLLARPNLGDITEYFGYAHRTFDGQVPYRDFRVEYPPAFLPVVLAAGPADSRYYDRFRLLMLALGAAALVLLVVALYLVGAGVVEISTGVLLLATLPYTLGPGLTFERFDLWPAALLLVAVVALLEKRRPLAFATLAVGSLAKLYPIVVVPLALLAPHGGRRIRRDLAVFAAAALAFSLPFMIVAPRGVAHVGRLLVRRPLHVESLGSSILLAAHRLGVYEPTIYNSFAGSWDLAGPAAQIVAVVSTAAGAVALVVVWVLFARGPRGSRELLLAVAAAVVAFVTFGKVFSPQYMVWIATAVPLALGRVRMFALPATLAAILLTRYVYVDRYHDLLQAGQVSWLLLARNLILVALFCALAWDQRRSASGTPL